MAIILSELGLVYPKQSSMTLPVAPFALVRLSQFNKKDEAGVRIEDEWANPCYTTSFGRESKLKLPDGSSLSLTVSKWKRSKDGAISNPSSGENATYWFNEEDEEKLQVCLDNDLLYLYCDTSDADADLLTEQQYIEHINKGKLSPVLKVEKDTDQPTADMEG